MKFLVCWLFLSITICKVNAQLDLQSEIDSVFSQYTSMANVKNAVLQIYSETRDMNLILCKECKSDNPIDTIRLPFYAASITKMLTATSIGILKDKRKIKFDDRINKYLPNSVIEGLHVLDGKEYSKDINIAHLLQHTSGLPDYFSDPTIDLTDNVLNLLLVDPTKYWSPQELIKFTKEKMKPSFIPGMGYHYSDTEYVLLGLIIEDVSGLALDEFFRQYIFEPVGMESSYLNLKSTSVEMTHPATKFYVGDIELSSIKSLSADWGGGGLVTTTEDLIRFFKAFNDDAIVSKQTRMEMQQWVYEAEGIKYGFGLRKVSFEELFDEKTDLQLIGHTGSTASYLWYCPQLDTYLVGTLNQVEASKITIHLVYEILKKIDIED